MPTTTALLNRALARIGEQRVLSINDPTPAGQVIRDVLDDCRRALLASHPWNFATFRYRLAPLANTRGIVFGWDYQFRKPASGLRHGIWIRTLAVAVDEDFKRQLRSDEYEDQGFEIAANIQTLYLNAVFDVANPDRLEPLFREAYMYKLAAELAISLANSNSIHDRMTELHDRALSRARAVDAANSGRILQHVDTWESARWGNQGEHIIGETP